MKLRNKKTGEIIEYGGSHMIDVWYDISSRGVDNLQYSSLAELNEDWEDYEEPKEYWYIDWNGEVCRSDIHDERTEQMKQIGNYFTTKEETEKAAEKLKAWKRLENKGAKFYGWGRNHTGTYELYLRWEDRVPRSYEVKNDIDLLFGGEE